MDDMALLQELMKLRNANQAAIGRVARVEALLEASKFERVLMKADADCERVATRLQAAYSKTGADQDCDGGDEWEWGTGATKAATLIQARWRGALPMRVLEVHALGSYLAHRRWLATAQPGCDPATT